jgi:enoyl-CoA hydratase/carnithine racemase
MSLRLQTCPGGTVLRLWSADGTNRLTEACVREMTRAVEALGGPAEGPVRPLVLTGNSRYFSAGADLKEIAALRGAQAFRFARRGQRLMAALSGFPALTVAAIHGYCMGGGLDLALACHRRIAAPDAVFGHRGAALGIMTGWGGTQRLPRLIGRPRALQMFLSAERLIAQEAWRIGLVDALADDPVAAAMRWIRSHPEGGA